MLKRDDGEYNASDHDDRSNHSRPLVTKSAHRLPGRAAGVGIRNGLLNVHKEGILFMLLLKSLRIGFVGLMLFVASAWAASSVLEGIVKDAKGHPIEGADIRIETKNGGKLLITVKTDVSGRYILEGLPPGTYRVTLAVNGAVKTSINNTTIESDAPTQLNFDLGAAIASRASVTVKKGVHRVWIPAFTGSRLPGHWVELNDSGSWAGEASSFHVVRVSGEELQRTIHSKDLPPGRSDRSAASCSRRRPRLQTGDDAEPTISKLLCGLPVRVIIAPARLNPQEETPAAEDIAVVPFACRSLTFDGERFWSNYRAKDTIISFALPN